MPVSVDAREGDDAVVVTCSGEVSLQELVVSIEHLSIHVEAQRAFLVDFSDCQLMMTAAQFMQAIDDWFSRMGREAVAALVFHADAQKDQAMLFETKNVLMGGRTRSFTDVAQAEAWIASMASPAR